VTPFAGFSEFGLLSADYADLWVSCDSKAKSLENKFLYHEGHEEHEGYRN
jgi:hypothetical protein